MAEKQISFDRINLFSDLIMVEPIKVEPKTRKTGLILPASGGNINSTADVGDYIEWPYQARVLRIGSGIINDKKIDMEMSPGDILFMWTPLDLNREVVMIDGVVKGLIRKSKVMCSFKALK